MASPARIRTASKLQNRKPSAGAPTQVFIPRPARDRTAALARLSGLDTTGALFVGEVMRQPALSVVAVRGDRVEQRWLTELPDDEVTVIPTEAISSVVFAKGTGSTRRVVVRAAGRETTFELDAAAAQAFHIALTAILAFARSPIGLRLAS